jgi:hypothetical protein
MPITAEEQDQIGAIRNTLSARLSTIYSKLKEEAQYRDPWNGPLHAAEVGALNLEYQWLDVLLRSVLFNYETALSNWYLNDAAYRSLHLPQPPKPALPSSLAAFLPKSE